jgi:hypothetical protein
MHLKKHLLELESAITHADKIAPEISNSTIGWQIDHTLRVITNVYKALEKSDPSQYKPKFSFVRAYIFLRGSIPRGRGKAPKIAVAQEAISVDEIQRLLTLAKSQMQKIGNLPPKAHFPHPYFGNLKLKPSLRFLEIHTEHHLKIIRDILKSAHSQS